MLVAAPSVRQKLPGVPPAPELNLATSTPSKAKIAVFSGLLVPELLLLKTAVAPAGNVGTVAGVISAVAPLSPPLTAPESRVILLDPLISPLLMIVRS